MPCYSFHHPKNESKIVDIVMSMNEDHRYIDDKGVEWVRIWTKPCAAIDSKWDCRSENDFVTKTAAKKGTLGDVWDKSAELSAERAAKDGVDPVKSRYYKNQRSKRSGKASFHELKDQAKKANESTFTIG